MKGVRSVLIGVASAGCLALAFHMVDLDALGAAATSVALEHVAIATLLILCNAALSFVRLRFLLGYSGYTPKWGPLFSAFAIGQLANFTILNVIGQSIGRAGVLASVGVPFGATVVVTFLERILAAGILLSAALVAAWFLIPHFGFDLHHGGAYLLHLVGGMALVGLVAMVAARRQVAVTAHLVRCIRHAGRLWPGALLTVLAHACMLGAYLAVLQGQDLPALTLEIAAALTMVMFAASMPISFAGWGIRELSAIVALGAVGVAQPTALAAALVVGGLSFILMAVMGALSPLVPHTQRKPGPNDSSATLELWNVRLITVCATLTAPAIFFQLRAQFGDGIVSVNIADVVALVGLGSFALLLVGSRGRVRNVPRRPALALLAISLVMALGLALGYAKFGANEWALINRGFGWLIILGYVAVGFLIAHAGGESGRRLVIILFVAAGVTIAASQLVLLIAWTLGLDLPQEVFTPQLTGYANNPNAFALQMVMTAIATIIADRLGLFGANRTLPVVALALTGLAIWYTGSRTGLGLFVLATVLSVLLARPSERRPALVTVALAAAAGIASALVLFHLSDIGSAVAMARPKSDAERWQTIVDGWRLWLDSPFLGNGLGAYVESRLARGQDFQVIHSVPIWFMAEMGIVGLAGALFFFASLSSHARRLMRDPARRAWGTGLVMTLACWVAASLVHDVFYQRSFWFVIALSVPVCMAAAGPSSRPRTETTGAGCGSARVFDADRNSNLLRKLDYRGSRFDA